MTIVKHMHEILINFTYHTAELIHENISFAGALSQRGTVCMQLKMILEHCNVSST